MFEAIGEGHKIMAEGPKKEIGLDALEKLAAQATPGPWEVKHLRTNHEFVFAQAPDCDMVFHAREEDVQYITAACNSLPTLIAENRALRERVRELERQREYLAFELSTNDDQADCNHTHLSCEHRKGWLCKAGLKGQVQCWISEAEKAAKEGVE